MFEQKYQEDAIALPYYSTTIVQSSTTPFSFPRTKLHHYLFSLWQTRALAATTWTKDIAKKKDKCQYQNCWQMYCNPEIMILRKWTCFDFCPNFNWFDTTCTIQTQSLWKSSIIGKGTRNNTNNKLAKLRRCASRVLLRVEKVWAQSTSPRDQLSHQIGFPCWCQCWCRCRSLNRKPAFWDIARSISIIPSLNSQTLTETFVF